MKILQVFEEARVGSKAVFIHGDVVIVIRTKLFKGVRVLEKVTSNGVRNDVEDYTYIFNKTGAQSPLRSGGRVRFDSAFGAKVRW